MKTPQRPQGFRAPAFTLIELMVVIAIILVLATMTVIGTGWYKRRAAEGKTQILVKSIERALEEYKSDNGFFPVGDGGDDSTLQVYVALYGDGKLELSDTGDVTMTTSPDGNTDNGNQVYMEGLNPDLTGNKQNVDPSNYTIMDAWGSPLHYRHDPAGNDDKMMNPPSDFDLWSLGANGKGGPNSGTKKDRSDDIKNW